MAAVPSNCGSKSEKESLVFDASVQQKESNIPKQFIWPDDEKPNLNAQELNIPSIDIGRFLSGDPLYVEEASRLISEACQKHGFFLIVNHGVDPNIIKDTHQASSWFFNLPLSEKQRAERQLGDPFGYASSLTNRFSTKLPWKETLSFRCLAKEDSTVHDYFINTLGEDFESMGNVFQEYTNAMSKLSLETLELIGTSLGVGRTFFREFYEDNDSIMRLNYYPPCQQPGLVLGTGPHTDTNSITILHQDQVDGLQAFVDNDWYYVSPSSNAFVVNIGDCFVALTNGKYKSCLHRVVVNSEAPRKSFVFFLSPNREKVIRAPSELVSLNDRRLYPDFTWHELLEFTQKKYRVDLNTLDAFSMWLGKNDN